MKPFANNSHSVLRSYHICPCCPLIHAQTLVHTATKCQTKYYSYCLQRHLHQSQNTLYHSIVCNLYFLFITQTYFNHTDGQWVVMLFYMYRWHFLFLTEIILLYVLLAWICSAIISFNRLIFFLLQPGSNKAEKFDFVSIAILTYLSPPQYAISQMFCYYLASYEY